jgi:hypothetical protein
MGVPAMLIPHQMLLSVSILGRYLSLSFSLSDINVTTANY